LHDLWHPAFPFVDADQHLDAKVFDEDDVQEPGDRSKLSKGTTACATAAPE
jgi:hypothetical protein